MIEIQRKGDEVVLQFSLFIPTWEGRIFPMSFNTENTVYAGLLTEAMQVTLGDSVAAMRREAYEQGWKDAKGKRRRCDLFSRRL